MIKIFERRMDSNGKIEKGICVSTVANSAEAADYLKKNQSRRQIIDTGGHIALGLPSFKAEDEYLEAIEFIGGSGTPIMDNYGGRINVLVK